MRILFIFFLLVSTMLAAQNLVPNGGFETYTTCTGQITDVTGWSNPNQNSPDYLNSCSTSFGVPKNMFGYQNAHGDNAYVGLVVYYDPGAYNEYVQIELTESLVANQCYQFEMYVSLGEEYSRYTTDDWGAYFSNTKIVSGGAVLPFIPQFNNANFNYPDTTGWLLSSGSFVATGGEKFLIVGNFKTSANTTIVLANNFIIWEESYIFIDDISLQKCTGVGIIDPVIEAKAGIYPQPFGEILNIKLSDSREGIIKIYNSSMVLIAEEKIGQQHTINTSEWKPGIYFYELVTELAQFKSGKIIKK